VVFGRFSAVEGKIDNNQRPNRRSEIRERIVFVTKVKGESDYRRTECKGEMLRARLNMTLDQVAPAAGPKSSEIRPSLNYQPRVLVVEDHDDTRSVLERFLTRAGFQVAAAEDLKTGLNFLETEPFTAIISDIALPDGTGYALISEARRRGIRAVAIALSAYSYPAEVFQPGITGFDYHLRKPFDLAKLRSLLQTAPESGDAAADN